MPFKKGMNRSGGREKGTANKITTELRSMISDFLTNEWESVMTDFKQLQPKERLIFYERLLQYCIPKNSKVDNDSEENKFEQPIFESVYCYELDLEKIQYQDLKEMIQDSAIFMSNRNKAQIRIELPDNHRQYVSD